MLRVLVWASSCPGAPFAGSDKVRGEVADLDPHLLPTSAFDGAFGGGDEATDRGVMESPEFKIKQQARSEESWSTAFDKMGMDRPAATHDDWSLSIKGNPRAVTT